MAQLENATRPSAETQQATVSSIARIARHGYTFFCWVFLGCIVAQVYFAGLGLLVDSGYWSLHTRFGERIAVFVPIILLVLAIFSRFSWQLILLTGALFLLYDLQWFFLYAPITISGELLLRALHPVNALALFWLTLTLMRMKTRQ